MKSFFHCLFEKELGGFLLLLFLSKERKESRDGF
jgi:hypothetical protein